MRGRGALTFAGMIGGAAVIACTAGEPASPGGPPALERFDAGVPEPPDAGEAGIPIVVRTSAPPSSLSPGGRANATWAAYRDESGGWTRIEPRALGEYAFNVGSARWAVALVCADNKTSLVAIYERPSSETSLEAVLEEQCGPAPAPAYMLQGTLSHVPAATGWLEFGYGLDARGALLIATGTTAPYEVVNVVEGTWDLAFGLRNEAGTALTRVALVRGRSLAADTTLDLDYDVDGLVPETKKLDVTGIASAEESLTAPVLYTTNAGTRGIDLGPQDIPSADTVALTYATIPAASQQAGDRYRLRVAAEGPDSVSERGISAVFHDALDVALALPAPMPEPRVMLAGTTPYVRVTTKLTTRANAAAYEVLAVARITQKSRRSWRTSIDGSLASESELEVATPDLSLVSGFDPTWALSIDLDRTITATVQHKPAPLGDGSAASFAARSVTLPP